MEILITGATGFVGTALCAKLREQGHRIVCLSSKNCDLIHADSLLNFNTCKYDQIYHLAAWTQAGDFCLYHQGEQWIINQKINTNVLTWWHQCQPQAKMICLGTSCAYATELPLNEENYLLGLPIPSLFTYAMTKRMLYVGLLALQKQYGLRYLYLVPSTLYGPRYHTDGRQMHFIFDLIRKILRAKIYGETAVLWGDGYQARELVLVDDFLQTALLLAAVVDNEIINIGAGQEFTIRYFAQLICEKAGYNFNAIQFDTSRYVGAHSKCLVINKLKQYLPNLSFTPLEIGIEQTLAWFWQEREKLLEADHG
jgi:GDP-L-fucose synthase